MTSFCLILAVDSDNETIPFLVPDADVTEELHTNLPRDKAFRDKLLSPEDAPRPFVVSRVIHTDYTSELSERTYEPSNPIRAFFLPDADSTLSMEDLEYPLVAMDATSRRVTTLPSHTGNLGDCFLLGVMNRTDYPRVIRSDSNEITVPSSEDKQIFWRSPCLYLV